MENIIAYDLGTGGVKGVMYDSVGRLLADSFFSYETWYPNTGWHEQAPDDWWNSFIKCTQDLIARAKTDPSDIACLALSGHSCGAVPIDKEGRLLRKRTPIWSDMRANVQAERFLKNISLDDWYDITGANMPGTYSVFKLMWYMDNEPDVIQNAFKIIGTKDYINFLLTGNIVTDHSYATSNGVYDLFTHSNSDLLIRASGIDRRLLPDIIASTDVVGAVTEQAAKATGLKQGVKVVCGGVDNACMALGSGGIQSGRTYTNLGSSAWIAITTDKPLIDHKIYSNVFGHILPGKYASAVTIFSAGNSIKWVRDVLCADIADRARTAGIDPYDLMMEEAEGSPLGANRLVFNPTLSMGTLIDYSVNTKGAFTGLELRHTRADLLRAAIEGVTIGLGRNLTELRRLYPISDEMLLVGGGSNSPFWMQIIADVYGMPIRKTDVGQNAGALGAAATAAVGVGIWDDLSIIDSIHKTERLVFPIEENVEKYRVLAAVHDEIARFQGAIGDRLSALTV